MKRFIAYSMILLVVFSRTDVRELIRVPAMVLHYFDHKAEDSDLSFADFIHEHYCSDERHAHSHKHCGELPYQDCDNHYVVFPCHVSPQTTVVDVAFHENMLHTTLYASSSVQSISMDFWHPPRV